MSPAFGDHVRCDIGDGRPASDGYVLGVLHYAPKGDVILVGDEQAVGMPINTVHCSVLSSGHGKDCARWRARYLSRFGQHWLQP